MATGQLSTGQIIAGRLSKSVAGSANVTLTAAGSPAESTGYLIYEFTGALTGSIQVIWPALVDGLILIVRNATTGAFTLTAIGPSGTGIVVPQGFRQALLCDGTNFVPWGSPVATGQISPGQVIVGRLSKSVAGAVDVTLSTAEATQYGIYEFTGAITANINVIFPAVVDGRQITVFNNTTGAFTLTVKGVTGTGIVVGTAKRAILYSDATNMVRATADV